MAQIKIINSKGRVIPLDMLEFKVANVGKSIETVSTEFRLPIEVVSGLALALGWFQKRAEILQSQRETAEARWARVAPLIRAGVR